jgi:hypothetical protein
MPTEPRRDIAIISAKFEWWFKQSGESIVNDGHRRTSDGQESVVISAISDFVDETFTVTIGAALTIRA